MLTESRRVMIERVVMLGGSAALAGAYAAAIVLALLAVAVLLAVSWLRRRRTAAEGPAETLTFNPAGPVEKEA